LLASSVKLGNVPMETKVSSLL